MDYQKKYEEALNKAKDMLSYKEVRQEDMEYLFPELKESEDEKIRNEIILYIGSKDIDLSTHNRWLSWLEKQGNLMKALQTSNARIGELIEENYYLKERLEKQSDNPAPININKMVMEYSHTKDGDFGLPVNCMIRAYRQGINDALNLSSGIENQGEQKPTDMIEPKFHEGDWVADNCGYVWKIEGILNQFYLLEGIEGGESRPTIEWVNKTFRLWNISDAKDGDVLATKTGGIFIYKELLYNKPFAYCGVDKFGVFKDCNCGKGLDWTPYLSNVTPATKEQRDLLFSKMKEAGYMWDADKKELQKIEQKPADKVEPKFHEGDWVVNKFGDAWHIDSFDKKNYQVSDGKGNYNYFPIVKQDEMRHWSIADVKDGDILSNGTMIVIFKQFEEPSYRQHIVAYIGLDNNGDIQVTDDIWELGIDKANLATKEQRDLLFTKMKEAGYTFDFEKKELKKVHVIDEGKAEMDYCFTKMMNGEQVSSAWSEEDKRMLESLLWHLRYSINGGDVDHTAGQIEIWLKNKLKSHHLVKREWSEEDEKYIAAAIELVTHCSWGSFGGFYREAVADWLKALKERITWKPSDEQLDALHDAAVYVDKSMFPYPKGILMKLYEQLKKLEA